MSNLQINLPEGAIKIKRPQVKKTDIQKVLKALEAIANGA